MNKTQEDWILAALTPGMGPVAMLKLVRAFGSISTALNATHADLTPILGQKTALALKEGFAHERCRKTQAWLARPGTFLLTLLDEDYPSALSQIAAPPPLLFGLGRRALLTQAKFAIVGSRRAQVLACKTAQEFAALLAAQGYTIVSGLASGIDSAAHSGALKHPASSIAIIGTGIDRVYPASNVALAQRLAQEGLILSEFPLGTKPLAHHFPQRNRIIAGLTCGCLVVEASIDSGSLITARLAAEAGREVMAIPGSIHHPHSRGCHQLIKAGAKLVETIEDILDEIGTLTPLSPAKLQPTEESDLTRALGVEPVTIDQLVVKLGLTSSTLYAMLLQLELEGQVASLPGGRFQRLT